MREPDPVKPIKASDASAQQEQIPLDDDTPFSEQSAAQAILNEPPEFLEPLPDYQYAAATSREIGESGSEPPPAEPVALEEEDASSISGKWRGFVDEVARHANVSLVSLLRNAVVLELNDKKLVIGYQNIQLFTEEKRLQIEKTAKAYFNETIQVIYRESRDGLDDSLKVKHDMARAREDAAIREKARQDGKVVEILNVFPKAEIEDITILEEKKD